MSLSEKPDPFFRKEFSSQSEAQKDKWTEHLNTKFAGKTYTFHSSLESTEDRVSEVYIDEVEEILGMYGTSEFVMSVKASVVVEETKSPTHRFVLKVYNEAQGSTFNSHRALKNYKTLIDAGLPTWTTYRIDENDSMVLMTSGNQNDKTLVTGNENLAHTAQDISEKNITTITNFGQFLQDSISILKKADEKKIFIPNDAWGFFIDNSAVDTAHTRLEIIIADLDYVEGSADDEIRGLNCENFIMALNTFFLQYLTGENRQAYKEACNKALSNLL